MTNNKDRRPGDILLDRYFPDADEATREAAREEFKRFIHAVLKIAMRQVREQSPDGDSPGPPGRRTIPPVP